MVLDVVLDVIDNNALLRFVDLMIYLVAVGMQAGGSRLLFEYQRKF